VYLNLTVVLCGHLKTELSAKANALATLLLDHIADHNVTRSVAIKERFKIINNRIAKRPNDSMELVEAEKYLTETRTRELGDLLEETRDIGNRLDFLFSHNFLVTETILRPVGITFSWAKRIGALLTASEGELKSNRHRLEGVFSKQKGAFVQELKDILSEVEMFDKKGATYVDELSI
jgi:hypothetical protein